MKAACGRTRRSLGLVVWAEPGKLLFVKPGKMFRCSTGPRVRTAFTVCVATPTPSHSQIQPEQLTAAILLITVVLNIHHVFKWKEMNSRYKKTRPKTTLEKTAFLSGMGRSLQHVLKLKAERGPGSCKRGPSPPDLLRLVNARCSLEVPPRPFCGLRLERAPPPSAQQQPFGRPDCPADRSAPRRHSWAPVRGADGQQARVPTNV